MKAMDLLRQSQKEFTDSETLGVSEPIDYFHRKDVSSEPIRAFVSSNVRNDLKKNIRIIESKFSSLELNLDPVENDEITYEGKVYKVKDWEQSQGRWVVYTVHKAHHTGKRVVVK